MQQQLAHKRGACTRDTHEGAQNADTPTRHPTIGGILERAASSSGRERRGAVRDELEARDRALERLA